MDILFIIGIIILVPLTLGIFIIAILMTIFGIKYTDLDFKNKTITIVYSKGYSKIIYYGNNKD